MRHGGGVDESRPELEPGQEGAGRARPLAVEELGDRGAHPDGDDDRRVGRVGQHQGGVRGRGGGLDHGRTDPEPLDLLDDRRGAPPVRADHDVAGGAQGGGRWQVLGGVDHDDVDAYAGLPQRVGGGTDADDDRVLLADERAYAGELGLVVVLVRHHDHRPSRDRGGQPGYAEAVQQQVLLPAEELGAVVRQPAQLRGQPGPGQLHLRRDRVLVEDPPARDLDVADEDGAVVDPDLGAVGDRRPAPTAPMPSTMTTPAAARVCGPRFG